MMLLIDQLDLLLWCIFEPLAAGDNIKKWISTAPLLLPNKVMFSGSPPKALIFSLIHFNPITMSFRAWLPEHSSIPRLRNPIYTGLSHHYGCENKFDEQENQLITQHV